MTICGDAVDYSGGQNHFEWFTRQRTSVERFANRLLRASGLRFELVISNHRPCAGYASDECRALRDSSGFVAGMKKVQLISCGNVSSHFWNERAIDQYDLRAYRVFRGGKADQRVVNQRIAVDRQREDRRGRRCIASLNATYGERLLLPVSDVVQLSVPLCFLLIL